MSEDARRHLLLWLDHNIDLSRRKFENDQLVLERQLAARGLFYSGMHIKEVIALASKAISALTLPAFDKAGTLPEVADGNDEVLARLKAYATLLIEKSSAVIQKITKRVPTSPGLWQQIDALHAAIFNDLNTAASLASFRRMQSYSPPVTIGWDLEASKAAARSGQAQQIWIDTEEAALWIAYRDATILPSSEAGLKFRKSDERAAAYAQLVSRLIERSLVAFGWGSKDTWTPIPAELFIPRREITLEPSPLEAYATIKISQPDLLALFPPMPTSGIDQPAAPSKIAPLQARVHASRSTKRLPDALLNGWWGALGPDRDSLTLGDLWKAVQAAYPNYSISRDRIRQIAGPRKRGPKGSAVM